CKAISASLALRLETADQCDPLFATARCALSHLILPSTRSQQALVRNTQALVQALDHPQAQWPLAIKHLRYTAARPDIRLQIARRQPLLIHTKFDGLDR